MAGLALGPLIEARSIHDNLAIWSQLDIRAVHGTRRGAFEVHAFAVIAAAVAGTLEFVFAGLPVRCAAKVRATCINNEHAIRRAVYPNAVFLLPLGIHSERVVGGIADFENRGRLKERTRKEKAEESNEPGAEEASDGNPD